MDFVCAAAKYAVAVPDVVWSGVLASLITLTGVMLANWNSRRQLQMQLDHGSTQEDLERKMALRREVFMEGAKWATATVHLPSAYLELDEELIKALRRYMELMPVASQLEMVGDQETVTLALELCSGFWSMNTKLRPLRRELDEIIVEIDDLENQRKACVMGSGQELALKASINSRKANLDVKWKALRDLAYGESAAHNSVTAKLLVSMRREMDLKINAEEYLSVVKRLSKKLSKLTRSGRPIQAREVQGTSKGSSSQMGEHDEG